MEDWLDDDQNAAEQADHDKLMRDREYNLMKSEFKKVRSVEHFSVYMWPSSIFISRVDPHTRFESLFQRQDIVKLSPMHGSNPYKKASMPAFGLVVV